MVIVQTGYQQAPFSIDNGCAILQGIGAGNVDEPVTDNRCVGQPRLAV